MGHYCCTLKDCAGVQATPGFSGPSGVACTLRRTRPVVDVRSKAERAGVAHRRIARASARTAAAPAGFRDNIVDNLSTRSARSRTIPKPVLLVMCFGGCTNVLYSSLKPKSAWIASNSASAALKSSTISAAIASGAGRFEESSRLSSLSQKMSKLALSRCISSS